MAGMQRAHRRYQGQIRPQDCDRGLEFIQGACNVHGASRCVLRSRDVRRMAGGRNPRSLSTRPSYAR